MSLRTPSEIAHELRDGFKTSRCEALPYNHYAEECDTCWNLVTAALEQCAREARAEAFEEAAHEAYYRLKPSTIADYHTWLRQKAREVRDG
jgi:hypothetical protein